MSNLKYYLKQIKNSKELYLLFAIPLLWYIVFKYVPIYGLQIAFKRYNATLGISDSPWVGLKYFTQFFRSYYCGEVIWNTLKLSLYTLVIGFPIPIILALLINEIQNKWLSKTVQNITYMTNFLSVVVIVSMLNIFSDPAYGLFNQITGFFGAEPVDFMAKAVYFSPLYVLSNVWQFMGFNAIIYIAALASIDPTYYEAASIDGASRFQRIIHISIPCIITTIIIMFILRIGNLMTVGFEKVLLMQNSVNTSTSEIISTFIYKNGIKKGQFSYSAAVGIFNSVINFILLISANTASKKVAKTSLW